jgi:hypothetical protein
LSPEFAGLLSHFRELLHINLNVFNSITSPLAQAIYLYIPSRAYHHHTEQKPFEITLTNLLQQVSATVPVHKSRRHELFTKNRNPIINQLNGLETLKGIFRVKLAETNDKSDWKLQAWVDRSDEQPNISQTDSKILTAYLKSGRSREQFNLALANLRPLSEYDIYLLTKAEVEIEGNRAFLEQAKALLKEARFTTLLAEAKSDQLEGRKARKSPTARLIYRIMEALATPAHAPA